eukprot:CAMPEP_0178398150 /NCGR_PEP_ID=MMETSP0689_2-20121128/14625_1 /TAXON_ID=160604 /ORGANISM="Amphidinium massartii, Strain CS-259" /LENGTH=243 /DNA_ID=CAMNT_0020018905 /DNA_START=79 /DNA_END=810 /DNA_ORIENTATION=-
MVSRSRTTVLALALASIGCASFAFVAPSTVGRVGSLRGAQVSSAAQTTASVSSATVVGSAACVLAVAGVAAAAAAATRRSKVARQYTTQIILPSLTWLKSGVSAGELAPGELRAVTLGGNDVLLGKTESGSLFGVSNLCPHIGTPLSEGADVIGDIIVCPLHGSSWSVKSGELLDWCVSPPIIGPLTGILVEKKNLFVFEVRTGLFGTGEIEVQVDTNAKKAYEADYWKGVLDAQGKNDGTYY